jgi:hypothetical protein
MLSNTINTLARDGAISFLNAARQYDDTDVLRGIDEQAHELNAMIDELLSELSENEKALIVSHDLTIAPAMGFRGMSAEFLDSLNGYILSMTDGISSVCHY